MGTGWDGPPLNKMITYKVRLSRAGPDDCSCSSIQERMEKMKNVPPQPLSCQDAKPTAGSTKRDYL